MAKAKAKDKKSEVEEVVEVPEVEESPEPEPEEEVQEQFIDLDRIPLVFNKETVDKWLGSLGARKVNVFDSAMLLPQALRPKQSVTLLLFAIQAVKDGGTVVVPEVFLGNEYLEDLDYLGTIGDFFAFRK